MDTNTILNTMATFGYAAGFLGILACVIAYFALPKAIKLIFDNKEEE
jgi:hypothetical protein